LTLAKTGYLRAMKQTPLFIFYAFLLFYGSRIATAQSYDYKNYISDFIFSSAWVDSDPSTVNPKLRFSLFYHTGLQRHYKFNNAIGFYTGFSIRNIGFISEENDTTFRRRTYNLGIPLALKLGKLSEFKFLFLGAEAEYAFHFKEKTYLGGNKILKSSDWFSQRNEPFQLSVFTGYSINKHTEVILKYYVTPFLNTNYFKGGTPIYADKDVHIFYVSLNIKLGTEKPGEKKKDIETLVSL
jgi:hypothetical protein